MKNKFIITLILFILAIGMAARAKESNKVYEINLNYKRQASLETLSFVNMQTAEGIAPDYSSQPVEGYSLEIISLDNQVLKSIKFAIPSGAVAFSGISNNAQGSADDFMFALTVPYFSNAKQINIRDKNGKLILQIPLTSVPKSGSASETQTAQKKFNLSWIYLAAPVILIIGFLSFMEFNRVNAHKELRGQLNQNKTLSLKNYIMANLRKGFNREQIRNALIKNHYNYNEIEEAFRGIKY